MYKKIALKDICKIWSGVKLDRLKKTNKILFSDIRYSKITYKVLTFKAIDENGNIDHNEIEEISNFNNNVCKYTIQHKDIVISFSVPVKVFYVRYSDDNIIATSHFAVIRLCDNTITSEYIYNYLENYFGCNRKYLSNTGMRSITIDTIKNIKIPCIPVYKQNEYNKLFAAMKKRIQLYQQLLHLETKKERYIKNKLLQGDIYEKNY